MDKLLIGKTFCRFLHLLSAGFFIGSALSAMTSSLCDGFGSSLSSWMWLLALISGLGNMIILILIKRPQKEAHSRWKHLLYAKLALLFGLYTPLLRWELGLIGLEKSTTGFQTFIVFLIALLSVYTRYYREDITKFFTLDIHSEFRNFEDEHKEV